MIVRNIKNNELEEIMKDFNEKLSFINSIKNMMEDGVTKPDWCFVSEDENKFYSLIIYAVFDTDLEIININIKDFNKKESLEVLSKSLKIMKKQGFKKAGVHIYSDKSDYVNYLDLLKKNNFKIIQEKKSFMLTDDSKITSLNRLRYKNLEEVGKDNFVEAIKKVTVKTLDEEDLENIKEYGEEKAAEKYFNTLKDIEFNPKMWKLAFLNDEFVGLVIPQVFSETTGAINYIGVIPEMRGNGYVFDLLNEGINSLHSKGIEKIIADIDINNFPLEKALIKNNFKLDSNMFVLVLKQ